MNNNEENQKRDIDVNIEEMHLDVLSAEEALELFKKLIGERKVNKELETATRSKSSFHSNQFEQFS